MRLRIRRMPPHARHSLAVSLIAGALLAPACLRAQRRRAERWVVSPSAACQGLTIGWAVPTEEIRSMLDSTVEPAPGPAPGTGLVMLFVAKCPGSSIEGRPTGPFVSAHVIVPIAAPAAAHAPAARGVKGWIAIPHTFGPDGSPVRSLFARHGFAVAPGDASLQVTTDAAGTHARLVLATPHGRLTATATFGDSTRAFDGITGIVGGAGAPSAFAHGPERSTRRSARQAIVTSSGTTPVSAVHPVGKPIAVLDTGFVWQFTFEGR